MFNTFLAVKIASSKKSAIFISGLCMDCLQLYRNYCCCMLANRRTPVSDCNSKLDVLKGNIINTVTMIILYDADDDDDDKGIAANVITCMYGERSRMGSAMILFHRTLLAGFLTLWDVSISVDCLIIILLK